MQEMAAIQEVVAIPDILQAEIHILQVAIQDSRIQEVVANPDILQALVHYRMGPSLQEAGRRRSRRLQAGRRGLGDRRQALPNRYHR